MGRSVSTPSGAAVIVYTHIDGQDGDGDTWRDYIDCLRDRLTARYPSLSQSDRWLGDEYHVILQNAHAQVTVSEYCGLVAVCLVPMQNDSIGMAARWCEQVEAGFRKVVAEVFGGALRKVATASNGEAFFEQVTA